MQTTRRDFLHTSALAAATLVAPRFAWAADPVAALYQRALVIDGCGSPGGLDTEASAPLSDAEVADLAKSGMTAVHLTVGDVGTQPRLVTFESISKQIADMEREIDRLPQVLTRIRSAADLRAAKSSGRVGIIYGLQDGVAFEDDLSRLEILHQMGVRVIQPTYNRRNLLGDGCMEPSNAGLSRDGRAAIERMNALGLMLDMSHCGRQTTADAFDLSKKPVSFTHTGCYALAEHPRHRTDAEIRRASDSGGLTGIYIMPYLSKGKQPTANDVVQHVMHAIKVGGEDHVAIGTDGALSGRQLTPEYIEAFRKNIQARQKAGIAAPFETEEGYLFAADLNTPRRFETLAGKLLAAGLAETQVEKVLGANLLRVFEACW